MASPQFSFKVWPKDISWDELSHIWQELDSGDLYYGGWLFDHFYPPRGPVSDLFEAWTLLGSLAAITDRLRLGVMVSSNTFRHPALLAKMATTVDHVSNGRLEIGIGAGWHEAEHEAFGIDLPPAQERWERLDEACAILDGLLAHGGMSFHGEHFRLVDAVAEPRPVQRPRPPIVIGGMGPKRTLPLVARWADHWNFFHPQATAEMFAESHSILRSLCADIGRDADTIEISVQIRYQGSPAATRAVAETYVDAGADHVLVSFAPVDGRPADLDTLKACGEELVDIR